MHLHDKTLRIASILAALLLPALGCGDEEHAEENPNVEACEHLAEGPSIAVAARPTAGGTGSAIGNDHQRYDVTLVDVAGGKGGFVSFAAAKAGEYIVFTSAPVKLTVRSSTMATVAAEASSATVAECAEVKGRHLYDLEVGTYAIEIGPEAATNTVSLVVEASEGH